MIILSFREISDGWRLQCQSEMIDLLSFTLMRGYDLVITIIISFKESNNLKDLINLEKRERYQSVDYNPPTDFIKSLNQIRIMLIEMAPRSVTLINLYDMG